MEEAGTEELAVLEPDWYESKFNKIVTCPHGPEDMEQSTCLALVGA